MLWISAILLPIALLLLMLGLRGRVVCDHPFCRRCRFDLVNRWPDIERCPECGTLLLGGARVRNGRRRKRPIIITLGLLVLITGAIPLASHLAPDDLNPHKPAWWLRFEARHGSAALAEEALTDLADRVAVGAAPADALLPLIDLLLARQADPQAVWQPGFGDAVEAARATGGLAEKDWRTYLDQGVETQFSARNRARTGSTLTLHLEFDDVRLGSAAYPLRILWLGQDWSGDDEATHGSGGLMSTTLTTGRVGSSTYGTHARVDLPPGVYDLTAHAEHTITINGQPETTTHAWSTTIEILPEDAPLIELIRDPDIDRAVREAVELHHFEIRDTPPAGIPPQISITLDLRRVPVPVAFDIFLRIGEQEWLVESAAEVPGGSSLQARGGMLEDLDPPLPEDYERVDVILRASPEVAERNPAIERIWDGEILFEDVLNGGTSPPQP